MPGPTYTDAQVCRYLERIGLPPTLLPTTLETLCRLIAGHLHAIPFENLSLHYSPNPSISLDPEFLFDKFVNRKRGGYCMEQNCAFSTLLRSLGYNLYTIGGRVLQVANNVVAGFGHMAIILTLDGIEYLVDVGYGSNCLTAPLPIFNGEIMEEPIKGVIPEEHRIHRGELPEASKKGHKIWMLQIRYNPESEWETQYVFEKDFEFFSKDYEMYSHP